MKRKRMVCLLLAGLSTLGFTGGSEYASAAKDTEVSESVGAAKATETGEEICHSFLEQYFTISLADAAEIMDQLQSEMQEAAETVSVQKQDGQEDEPYAAEVQLEVLEQLLQEEVFARFEETAKNRLVQNRTITKLYELVVEKGTDFSVEQIELTEKNADSTHQEVQYQVSILAGEEEVGIQGRIQMKKEEDAWWISGFELDAVE